MTTCRPCPCCGFLNVHDFVSTTQEELWAAGFWFSERTPFWQRIAYRLTHLFIYYFHKHLLMIVQHIRCGGREGHIKSLPLKWGQGRPQPLQRHCAHGHTVAVRILGGRDARVSGGRRGSAGRRDEAGRSVVTDLHARPHGRSKMVQHDWCWGLREPGVLTFTFSPPLQSSGKWKILPP